MGKILVFADGSSIEFTDNSYIDTLTTVVNSYAEVDTMRAKFTEANLTGATFNGEAVEGVVPVSSSAQADVEGGVTVTFFNSVKADAEVKALKQQVAQLQAENAELTDKAQAADILLGNEEVES